MKVVDKQKALSGGVLEAKDDPTTPSLLWGKGIAACSRGP